MPSVPVGRMAAVSIRHKRFAIEFFKDFDALAAYDRTPGYQAANKKMNRYNAVSELMARPEVQQFLNAEFTRLQQRVSLEQEEHVKAVCELAYSDLRELCTWGPDGVILKDSQEIPASAARTVKSVKSLTTTRVIPRRDAPPIEETNTRVDIHLHDKVAAQSLLHTMFDKGQATRMALEVKLRALAALAGKYIPAGDHARYLAEVRLVLGDVSGDISGESAAL